MNETGSWGHHTLMQQDQTSQTMSNAYNYHHLKIVNKMISVSYNWNNASRLALQILFTITINFSWQLMLKLCKLLHCRTVPTKCLSFNSWTILDVHSPGGKISVLSLKSFKTQRAAHCLTLSFVSGETNSLGTSLPTASTISSLPIFAIHCSARQTLMGLRLDKSFLMLWIISLISSLFALTRTEIKR